MNTQALKLARLPLLVISLAAALAAGGCLTRQLPEKHRYLLAAQREGVVRTESDGILQIGRVRVEQGFDRRNFVYRTGEAEFEDDFYNEFYVAPRTLIVANLRDWLVASGLFSSVVALDSIVSPQWLLSTSVERMFVDVRGDGPAKVQLDMEFTLLDMSVANASIALRRRYTSVRDAESRTAPAFVDAWNAALTEILTRLETDLAAVVMPH